MPKDPPALSTRLPMPGLSSAPVKRFRPPNIDLTLASEKRGPVIEVESESPISDDDDDDILQLSSDSSPSTSPIVPILNLDSSDEEGASDDISKDLAALDQLRKSVQKNLKLRPIRSHSNLQKVDLPGRSPFAPPLSSVWRDSEPDSATSTTSSTYFTPLSDAHSSPQSARYLGFSTSNSSSPFRPPATLAPRAPRSIGPTNLVSRLTSEKRPLLIDTRPPSSHLSFHIRHSINIAIPSLILKRCRKPGGGFQSLDALRQFITTDQSKERWDTLLSSGGPWDGDVVVYDDEMDLKNKDNVGVTSWALLPVLIPLLSYGSVDYLEGGISAAGHCPDLEALIVSAGDYDLEGAASPQQQQGKKGGGLFQLDTQSALRSRALPEIEPSSASPGLSPIPPSPLPVMPAATRTTANGTNSNNAHQPNIIDASPSPPPSSVGFRRPPPPQRRPSVPGLQRISTTSAERLGASPPKLSVRTGPLRSATLSVPPSYFPSTNASLQPPASPSHLNLMYSNHSPPGSARWTPIGSSPSALQTEFLSAYFTPPHTPGTPKPLLPSSPSTARPELEQPPTTEEAFPVFIISTILPGFLYLGPELTAPEHVDELKELGVRRILNIAAECDDDQGLRLKEVFEKYVKIPMRDTVEEENIARGVREVCEILDDARLHSAPTYVHCKAGKSRSVTAVMAYLIHANHWTLSRAYSFVLERRKGISPNIGFVSELMTFEEEEIGGKSVGVQPSAPAGEHDPSHQDSNYGAAMGGGRRNAHVRESLPPAFVSASSDVGGAGSSGVNGGGSMSAGGVMDARGVMGDSGQEMEIKDSSGRYRHVRRAPVDENTLQPMRRVSKAGLESSTYA